MGRTLLLVVGTLTLLAPCLWADGLAAGEPAPALPEATWVIPPEAHELEGLQGHVVLLHLWGEGEAERAWPWLDFWQETFWKKGLRVVVLAHGDAEKLELAAKQRAFAYPVASVEALGAYEEVVKAGATLLLGTDGKVLWHGTLNEIDTAIASKVLRSVKPPLMEGSKEALDAWTKLAARCDEVGIPALAVDVYDRIQKAFKGLPEEEDSKAQERALKKDKQAKREMSAAKSFTSVATEWLKVGDSDRKKATLVKKINKFLAKNAGTRAGAHAKLLMGALRGGAALGEIQDFIAAQKIDTKSRSWRTDLPKPPKAEFSGSATYFWVLETSEGRIKIKLMPKVAPMHVSSTIYLTELGFFDGLTFHRVITGFMAQGGCPLGSGTGSPGYKFAGEYDKSVRHVRGGLLSMANSGPGTDGSQFFITFRATRHLDDKHTIYGEVVEGMDTVKKLEAQGSQSGTPKKKLIIETATIEVE